MDNIVNNSSEDQWGGNWTLKKINIFIKYLKAYLEIMKNRNFELIYFDGFAGSGKIVPEAENKSLIESVALQVLAINHQKTFDIYYLVELDKKKALHLEKVIKEKYTQNNIFVSQEDCNKKLTSLAHYLQRNRDSRCLAFIDPFGMQVNWSSLIEFKTVCCDMWLLVPTGVAVNRMLTTKGDIDPIWLEKLGKFFGLTKEEIKTHFYETKTKLTLFGEETYDEKKANAINKIITLYNQQLKSIWKHVSKAYPMKNNNGIILYHFIFASQNKNGKKIADEIIGKMN
jgi:three-Cys-motif partner protein